MAKTPGTGIKIGTHFSPRYKRPIDDRYQFDTLAEMTSFTENALYDGIETFNSQTRKIYKWLSTNPNDATLGKWREVVDASSVEDKVNELNNQVVHRKSSIPAASISNENLVYQYTGTTTASYIKDHYYQCKKNGAIYEYIDVTPYYTKSEADAKFQDIIQYEVLPVASEDLEGKVYQYIGVEAANRKVGSFYQCTETSTDVYDWVELQPEVESIQKETLPEPSLSLVNKIYQYIGPNVLGGVQKGYFYICVEDTENPGEYIWKQKNVQPSSEGGSTLERDITANVNVGGVTSGKTFTEGTSITDVLESILVKPVYQTVTLTLSEDLIQKIGTTISSVDMTAVIVKGDSPITNAKYYVGASLVDTKDSTTDPAIINGGTYTYEYSTPFSTDTIFKVDVLAGDHTETATKKIQFVNPYYTGSSTTSTIADFTGLTEEIVVKNTKKEVTYGVTDNEYLVFAYDKSYGSLTSIKDENNFENIGSWNKSELTVDGQDYFVYITQLPVTIETTFKYIFTI